MRVAAERWTVALGMAVPDVVLNRWTVRPSRGEDEVVTVVAVDVPVGTAVPERGLGAWAAMVI